jgi:5-formyltetrahydrofolate cyclo-ligase
VRLGKKGGALMNTRAAKQAIRQRVINSRAALSKDLRYAYSLFITNRILQLSEFQRAHTVLGYMNFGAEYASETLLLEALELGKRLALPKVNHHSNHLDLYWVDDFENQLATGLWGIREPIVERCERVAALNELEFVLLPGVAFSVDGSRLGYGKGFYDKLLADPNDATRVAAAFSIQIAENIPQETTDRKVEWLITEHETIHCAVPPE